MKWAATSFGVAALIVAVGALVLALATRPGGDAPASVVTTDVPAVPAVPLPTPAQLAPPNVAPARAKAKPKTTPERKVREPSCGDNGDATGSDNPRCGSSDDQAGDGDSGDNSGDNQAGDGKAGGA